MDVSIHGRMFFTTYARALQKLHYKDNGRSFELKLEEASFLLTGTKKHQQNLRKEKQGIEGSVDILVSSYF